MLRKFFIKDDLSYENNINLIEQIICSYFQMTSYRIEVKNPTSNEIIYTFNKNNLDDDKLEDVWENPLLGQSQIYNDIHYGIFINTLNNSSNIIISVLSNLNHENYELGRISIRVKSSDHISDSLTKMLNNDMNRQFIATAVTLIYTKISLTDKFIYSIDNYVNLLKEKDSWMPNHSLNVANFSLKIANHLKFSPSDEIILYFSSLLHDIGKLYVPQNILYKTESLSKDEYNTIKQHSERGYIMLRSELSGIPLVEKLPHYVRSHHEWYDGNGYPDGLIGNEIPIISRIITICDSIDSMLSKTAYKEPLSHIEIISELNRMSDKQFDPKLVNIAIDILLKNIDSNDILLNPKIQFITDTSMSFRILSTNEHISLPGNLLHDLSCYRFIMQNSIFPADLNDIYDCKITFKSNNDIVQYKINLDTIVNKEIIITKLEWLPMDQFFSLMWDVDAQLLIGDHETTQVKIIRLGGSSLSFTIEKETPDFLENITNSKLSISFSLSIDNLNSDFLIEGQALEYHILGNEKIVNFTYINSNAKLQDSLFKLIFRKQMLDRRIKI